jgi:hypothetical protein
MSKYIRWKNGQIFTEELLTENDEIHSQNIIENIQNIQKYYYGIADLKINEINMIQGVLSINHCSVTFSNGNAAKNFNNINEFQFQRVFHGQEIPVFLKYISNNDNPKYIIDEVIIDTQGDIYLGKIQNINGIYQLSTDGCYLDIQSHVNFLKFLSNAENELMQIYKYYQNDLINMESVEYIQKFTQSITLKQIINVLNSIYDNVHHPFDAYNLLCPYMFKYIKYDHNNNIRCLRIIIESILQCYKILEESNIVEMDDQYYYVDMNGKPEISIIINPRDDLIVSWAENTYICSKTKMKSIEKQVHRGLTRDVNRYKQYLTMTIYRDNNYMDESNIVCISRDKNVKILNMKILN